MNEILNATDPSRVTLSESSTVIAARNQISSDLAGDAVILNLNSGIYYGLDSIGAAIWQCIQQPMTVSDIRDTLLHEYDVDPAQCMAELIALLKEMLNEGLIDVKNEAGE
jgi:hypothetical protein